MKSRTAPMLGSAAVSTNRRQRADDAARRVLKQFRIVFNSVRTHFHEVERTVGVTGAQVWALSIIRDCPDIGVTELAAALNVRQPTASNLVKELARQGLVDMRREGPDRRAVQLRATAAGRSMLKRTPGPFAGVLPAALATLAPGTLRRLELDLAKLIKQLGVDEAGGTTPLGEGRSIAAGRAASKGDPSDGVAPASPHTQRSRRAPP